MTRHFFLTGALVAAVVTTGSAARADATPTGVELGLRSGYAIPLGNAVGGNGNNALSNTVSGVVPIWIDAGYRLNPSLMIGAYFQYGIGFVPGTAGSGQVTCATPGISCSANDLMFGVQAHYHFMPDATFDPWAGLGVGYEILNLSASANGTSAGQSVNGFQFVNVQAGGDYKVMPNFGVGPFVMFSLGQYSNCSLSGAASSSTCTIPQTAMHEWLTLGVRGVYDINL
jgi:hypothetical protein